MELSKQSMLNSLPVSDGPITLRRWTIADTHARTGWPSYPTEYRNFNFALAGASAKELERHFSVRDQDPDRIPLAADHTGREAIAYFALHEIDWENRSVGNVAFRMHPELCGKEFGSPIVRLAGSWCRDCGIRCIRLDVSAANVRAVRCYEKAGMAKVGQFWRDDPNLAGIDLTRKEHEALCDHFRIEGDMPQVRFWWMELELV